ncbi:MAG: polymorphic toxin type 4 domain-containing protein, partial [Arenibacterium sp.]
KTKTKKELEPGQSEAPNFNNRRNKKQPKMSELGLNDPDDWQRLHLWGPGFGDETAAGMFIGPKVVNQEWQNRGIEEMIRELGRQVAPHRPGFKLKCKATARCWSTPSPKGFSSSSGEAFLKEARYDIIIELPDGTKKTARIDITVGADPADINAGLDPAVHIGFDEAQFRDLFDHLPAPPPVD